jgi:hypothetical protein
MATNTACWKFMTASQVEPPREMPPDQAQVWCNFVLLMPGWLPQDCRHPFTGSLRTEASPGRSASDQGRPNWTRANTSSFSTVAHGNERRLRIKQFLYDWAPPASDHPSLWGHADKVFSIDSKRVAWLGTDYKKSTAASGILWGTMCEVRVLEGTFKEEELTRIMRELHPVDANAKALITATPFSTLSYWARHRCAMVKVPYGLWKFRRPDENVSYQWLKRSDIKRTLLNMIPNGPEGWQIDSVCVIGELDNPDEIDILYVLGGRDRYMWCATILKPDKVGLSMPPEKDAHPCQTDTLEVAGVTVHHAWLDDSFGPHDVVWEKNSRRYLVESNSAVGFDTNALVKLITPMIV